MALTTRLSYCRLGPDLVTLTGRATPLVVARAGTRPKSRNMNLIPLWCNLANVPLPTAASLVLLTCIRLVAIELSFVK